MAFNVKIKSKNNQVSLQKVIQGGKTLYIPLVRKELKEVATINSTLLQKTLVYDNQINDGNEITEPVVGQVTVVDDITSTNETITDIINPFNTELLDFDTVKNSDWWNIEHEYHNVTNSDIVDKLANSNYIHGYSYYPINGQGTTFNDLIMSAKWSEGVITTSGECIIPTVRENQEITHSDCIGFAQKYELVKNLIIDYNEPVTVSRLANIQNHMNSQFNSLAIKISVKSYGNDSTHKLVNGYVIPVYAKYYFNINEDTEKIIQNYSTEIQNQIKANGYYEIKPPMSTPIPADAAFLGAYVHVGIKPEYESFYETNQNVAIPLNHLVFDTANILHTANNYIPYNINLDNDNISKWQYKSDILLLADREDETNIKNCLLIKLNPSIYDNIDPATQYNAIVIYSENNSKIEVEKVTHDNIKIEAKHAKLAKLSSSTSITTITRVLESLRNYNYTNVSNLSVSGYIVGYGIEYKGLYQTVFKSAESLLSERSFSILPYNSTLSKKMLKECPYTDIAYYTQADYDIIESAIPQDTNIRYQVSNISNNTDENKELSVILGYILNEDNINTTTPSRRIYWMPTKINIAENYIYRISLLIPYAILKTLYLVHNALAYNFIIHHNINNTSDNALITNITEYLKFVKETKLSALRLTTPFYGVTKEKLIKNLPLQCYTLLTPSLNSTKTELIYQFHVTLNHNDPDTLITLENDTSVRRMEFHLCIPNGKYSIEVLRELNWCISFSVRYRNPINGNYNDTTIQIPLNQLTTLSTIEASQYINTSLDKLCYFIIDNEQNDFEQPGIGSTIEDKAMVGNNQALNLPSKAYAYINLLSNLHKEGVRRIGTYSTSFSKLLYPEHEDDKEGQLVYFTIHLDYVESNTDLVTIIK